jgi:hypothetical protein
VLQLAAALRQGRLQALAEREAQLQKARGEHKQYGAWLVEAHQQQATETARLQALAATLAAQEEQMRALLLQVCGGGCTLSLHEAWQRLQHLQEGCIVHSDAAAACANRTAASCKSLTVLDCVDCPRAYPVTGQWLAACLAVSML